MSTARHARLHTSRQLMMPDVSPNVGGQRSFDHVDESLRLIPA